MPHHRPATPQLDKMAAVQEALRMIGEFLAWLRDEGYVLCVWQDAVRVGDDFAQPAGYWPAGRTIEQILGDYYGIDLAAAERERQAILEWIRRQEAVGAQEAGL
ncbi:hypothetical protein [Thermaerobacter litoralis]